jgi:hypothetical protein
MDKTKEAGGGQPEFPLAIPTESSVEVNPNWPYNDLVIWRYPELPRAGMRRLDDRPR